jgi:hypothetical protein
MTEFDVGCWVLGVGCWVLDVGCGMLLQIIINLLIIFISGSDN